VSSITPPLIAGCSLAVACATLSIFVISRRWALLGEGISHSGFGGAGTVWLLMLLFPSIEHSTWPTYVGVVIACLATAFAIGFLTRGGRINSDAAIGIFMVASLAWGFLAQQVFVHVRQFNPVAWNMLLFGQFDIGLEFAIGAAAICAAVVGVVAFLSKEIIAYCFDPTMALAAGVRVGFIHYLLMTLVALTIIVGVSVAGSVLVTALLVLPGASAVLLSDRLRSSIAASILIGLAGAIGGLLIHFWRDFVPRGPAIVLVLFAEFLIAYAYSRFARRVRLSPAVSL
jgi:ABC-type Mn2+/Zn2+ transport system permease subunit